MKQANLSHKNHAGMGAVSLLDRMLRCYRPTPTYKTWWRKLFVKALNIAVVVSWILCSAAYKKIKKLLLFTK